MRIPRPSHRISVTSIQKGTTNIIKPNRDARRTEFRWGPEARRLRLSQTDAVVHCVPQFLLAAKITLSIRRTGQAMASAKSDCGSFGRITRHSERDPQAPACRISNDKRPCVRRTTPPSRPLVRRTAVVGPRGIPSGNSPHHQQQPSTSELRVAHNLTLMAAGARGWRGVCAAYRQQG